MNAELIMSLATLLRTALAASEALAESSRTGKPVSADQLVALRLAAQDSDTVLADAIERARLQEPPSQV